MARTRLISEDYLREHGWLEPMRQATYALFWSGVFAGFLFGVLVGVLVST